MESTFTHIENDRAVMVDIGNKVNILRRATACGDIVLRDATIGKILNGSVEKGNVFSTARIASILAVKRTPDLIPMCHQISISSVDVDMSIHGNVVRARVDVSSVGKTGVEMEALTGVSVALLTVWDMVKSAEKDDTGNYPETCINNIRVIEKVKHDQK